MIEHIRRSNRSGFKAGALEAGLARSSGEFLAIFDADFVPPADFLKKTLPWLTDPFWSKAVRTAFARSMRV